MKVDLTKIDKVVDDGYILKRRHWLPDVDYWIYNYAPKCQYEQFWNETTKMCRGLILDTKGNIIARPFSKFFNLEEHSSTTKLMKKKIKAIYDKLDGSLGISYFDGNEVYIATRGSFASDQANMANAILEEKYIPDGISYKLNKNVTYLFEIIYPENQIVVNYDGMEDLVLIAMIDIETGKDLELDYTLGFPVVEKFENLKLNELKDNIDPEKEGYVVLFDDGMRIKVKGEEYLRLHRLMTGINERHIWEMLRDDEDYEFMLDRVPDEFYTWFRDTVNSLNIQFDDIKETAEIEFAKIKNGLMHLDFQESRKEFAKRVFENKKTAEISGIMFALLDGKDIVPMIWKKLKPKKVTTFKCYE